MPTFLVHFPDTHQQRRDEQSIKLSFNFLDKDLLLFLVSEHWWPFVDLCLMSKSFTFLNKLFVQVQKRTRSTCGYSAHKIPQKRRARTLQSVLTHVNHYQTSTSSCVYWIPKIDCTIAASAEGAVQSKGDSASKVSFLENGSHSAMATVYQVPGNNACVDCGRSGKSLPRLRL